MFLGFQFGVVGIAKAEPATEAYKAIVKIRTFALNTQDHLFELGSGSGIIINDSGVVLTNYHVIEVTSAFDNSPQDGIYLICLPGNTVEEPDCSYGAKYIASDKDLDIALLQITNIPGLSAQSSFPYLRLSQTDSVNINSQITAIGYPGIGGATVTSTQGTVSGKVEKYGKQWIKTDAVISFGSSGGAAINSSNEVIGITSAGHSDMLGSLGYITNIISLNSWIIENQSKPSVDLVLANKLKAFATKEKSINLLNTFTSEDPRFSITKPSEWEFFRASESELYITNPSDEEGGYISIVLVKQPYSTDVNSIAPYLRQLAADTLSDSLYKLQENATVKIGNVNGKRIRYVDNSGINVLYAVPVRNYLMLIEYDYGTNDKDKSLIENIVQTVNVIKDSSFKELKSYTHNDPYFSFTVDRDWVVLKKNDKKDPIIIMNKKYRDFYIEVNITKVDDSTRTLNQDGLLKYYKDLSETFNKIGDSLDLKIDYTGTNPHYKTGGEFTDVIVGLTTIKSRNSNKILGYEYGFTKKINSQYILNISMYYNNADKKALATYQAEFNRLMKNFKVSKPQPKKDTDKDGLNDDDEKKYGTNPNKKDTDGDGYSDFEELKNGYNPLGKGKLKKK